MAARAVVTALRRSVNARWHNASSGEEMPFTMAVGYVGGIVGAIGLMGMLEKPDDSLLQVMGVGLTGFCCTAPVCAFAAPVVVPLALAGAAGLTALRVFEKCAGKGVPMFEEMDDASLL
jgi:hypothetical protein